MSEYQGFSQRGLLRDVGGLHTREGHRVAHGRLFRSGAPERLLPEVMARLRAHGIRVVCDLRCDDERGHGAADWAGATPRELHLAVLPDNRTTGDALIRPLLEDPSGGNSRQLMMEAYRGMPRGFARSLARFIDTLLDDDTLPVLVHCTEGKDRTGFVCALVLLALGVEREQVYADYLLSREGFDREHLRASLERGLDAPLAQPPADAALDALGVHADYLDAALREVELGWGSVDRYLEEAGGLDAARRRALRARLLHTDT